MTARAGGQRTSRRAAARLEGPRRTCVGCRREAPKHELLRVAIAPASSGAAACGVDSEKRMGGRGAYLCRAAERSAPRAECLIEAERRGGFSRALRSKVTLDRKLVESVGR